jgi:hypothetical protein
VRQRTEALAVSTYDFFFRNLWKRERCGWWRSEQTLLCILEKSTSSCIHQSYVFITTHNELRQEYPRSNPSRLSRGWSVNGKKRLYRAWKIFLHMFYLNYFLANFFFIKIDQKKSPLVFWLTAAKNFCRFEFRFPESSPSWQLFRKHIKRLTLSWALSRA